MNITLHYLNRSNDQVFDQLFEVLTSNGNFDSFVKLQLEAKQYIEVATVEAESPIDAFNLTVEIDDWLKDPKVVKCYAPNLRIANYGDIAEVDDVKYVLTPEGIYECR